MTENELDLPYSCFFIVALVLSLSLAHPEGSTWLKLIQTVPVDSCIRI